MQAKSDQEFCIDCRRETTYILREERKTRYVKDKEYEYNTIVAHCRECGGEVSLPGLCNKDLQLFDAYYRKVEGLITIAEIESLMEIYHIGKAPLSLALGFGEVTISRYLEGQIPSKRYSDTMREALYHPECMLMFLRENRKKISAAAYSKAVKAVEDEIRKKKATPKIQDTISYMLRELVEITPLALQKLLYFVQGIYLSLYGKPLFEDNCEAWVHGPVYPEVYSQYKKYGYNPIEDENILLDQRNDNLNDQEKEVIDLVIKSFGLYSGKVLECITHHEQPWITARGGIETIEYSKNKISKDSMEAYFKKIKTDYGMSAPADLLSYIRDMLKNS